MATSEGDIRIAVSLLLRQHGSLTTTQVKEYLETVMPFDEDDKQMSKTRSEQKIIQRIGNIVSHQKDDKCTYLNTYIIDKTVKPAIWSLLTGLKSNGSLRKIDSKEIQRRKNKLKTFKPKKIDWQALNDRRTELGRLGEEFVIRYETNRVLSFAPDDGERVLHLSEQQGDGAGFDIVSINEDGSERYIEVKTTQLDKDTPFYMTENERIFFDINKNEENLFIYRVFNFDKKTRKGDIEVISAKDLFLRYSFDPVSYKVTRLP